MTRDKSRVVIDADDADMIKEKMDRLRYDIYQKFSGPIRVTVEPWDKYTDASDPGESP